MIAAYLKQVKTQLDRWGFKLALKNAVYHVLYRERRKCFGPQNPERTFYVIRSVKSDSRFYLGVDLNLLANYSYALSHMLYAKERGWIPVIDQLNYPVYNKEPEKINGSDNPWEYFWEQPQGTTLEEVYKSKNVVLSKRSWYAPGNPEYSVEAHRDPVSIQKFHALMEEVPLQAAVKAYLDQCRERVFSRKGTVIGISMRNAGHAADSAFRAPGHPIQPGREELIRLVEKRMSDWNADYVFLATEEQENIRVFQEHFAERFLYLPRRRYNGWKVYTKDDPNPLYREGRRYQTALNYLVEMELLAQCDALIGSITSGLRYAIFRNGGRFKHLEILDCGRFPDPRRKDLK